MLSYSRLPWMTFYRHQDMRTLFLGLKSAFLFFGGATESIAWRCDRIDCHVHHRHLVNIRGNSFRMRQHRDLWRSLHADRPEAEAPARERKRRKEVASRS